MKVAFMSEKKNKKEIKEGELEISNAFQTKKKGRREISNDFLNKYVSPKAFMRKYRGCTSTGLKLEKHSWGIQQKFHLFSVHAVLTNQIFGLHTPSAPKRMKPALYLSDSRAPVRQWVSFFSQSASSLLFSLCLIGPTCQTFIQLKILSALTKSNMTKEAQKSKLTIYIQGYWWHYLNLQFSLKYGELISIGNDFEILKNLHVHTILVSWSKSVSTVWTRHLKTTCLHSFLGDTSVFD